MRLFTFSLLLVFRCASAGSQMEHDRPYDESGGLRGLQGPTPVAWRQGHVHGNPVSPAGYAFSVDEGAGFSERLRITSDGQLHMATDGAQPAIKMGDERNGWKIIAGRGSFTIVDVGGRRSNAAPFRIDRGAQENTLQINQDGSISVAAAIVNGINITALDQRLARFESVITIEDDGTATFQQGASVVGCLDVVGDCTGPRPPPTMNDPSPAEEEPPMREEPGERRSLEKDVVEFGTLHKRVLELESLVEKLSNQLKDLEKPQN